MKNLYLQLVLICLPFAVFAQATTSLSDELKSAAITEKLGEMVDIHGLKFRDETGSEVPLANYFAAKKPVIFVMAYYMCPGICGYLLNGTVNSLRTLGWSIGDQFEVVTVSINPREGADLAAAKKATYIEKYGRLNAEKGWHFLTGSEDQIQKLAGQLGFGYRYDEKSKEYAHSAGIFVLTPTGKISRVLYGIDFPNRDLKLALMEASNGQVGTIFERFLLYCYRYDSAQKGYSFLALRLLQMLSGLMVLGMAIYLFFAFRSERKLHV
jgi:protein SCO1/2